MTGKQKAAVWVRTVLSVVIAVIGLFFIIRHREPNKPIVLTGVVLTEDSDPQKQSPIAYAQITSVASGITVAATSDASGLFRLTLPATPETRRPVVLNFQHAGFQPLEMTAAPAGDEIYLARMRPVPEPAKTATRSGAVSDIKNVRVRYSEKAPITTNTGSLAKTFEVVNTGNVPCNAHPPCSPDDKWKATVSTFDVPSEGEEFRNVRLSCIAGPCPFTKIESQEFVNGGHNLQISIRNWSDTTTFLLEAEVSQTRLTDMVRESYPVIFGSSMNFTMPAAAEGPSIEGELNGHDIVFPLGPDLILSWATCTVKVAPDHTKLFRCDLKAAYRFKQ